MQFEWCRVVEIEFRVCSLTFIIIQKFAVDRKLEIAVEYADVKMKSKGRKEGKEGKLR